MEVNTNNIEEQILLYVDGELDTDGAQALLQYIALHPEWRAMLEEYRSLVMQPDTAIVFEGKAALLQPEEQGQTIVFTKANRFKQLRWAAAAILLIGATGLTWMLNRQEEGLVLPDVAGVVAPQPKQSPVTTTVSQKDTVAPAVVVAATQQTVKSAVAIPVQQQKQAAPQEQAIAQNQTTALAPLAGSTVTAIAMEEQSLAAGRKLELLPVQQQEVTEEVAINADALPQWLPVNAEKLEGVNDLLGHIKNVKEKVAAKAAVLKNSTFVLRFGAKEIAIGK